VKNEKPHYGLKEHALADANSGFILATTLKFKDLASPSDLCSLRYLL